MADVVEQIRRDGRQAAEGAPEPTDEQLRQVADVLRPHLREQRRAS